MFSRKKDKRKANGFSDLDLKEKGFCWTFFLAGGYVIAGPYKCQDETTITLSYHDSAKSDCSTTEVVLHKEHIVLHMAGAYHSGLKIGPERYICLPTGVKFQF